MNEAIDLIIFVRGLRKEALQHDETLHFHVTEIARDPRAPALDERDDLREA
ncbi:MAG: hypothetical protein K2Y20_13045 [Sphingomonas sp.]|nr:hypothetical protein [Sphingomonas sp.]